MARNPNTNVTGGPFTAAQINAVWVKATIVQGYDASLYRKDRCGTWICRTQYGSTDKWGWEIDHILPVARGGNDSLQNLQPLFWRTNRQKGDTFPWSCAA